MTSHPNNSELAQKLAQLEANKHDLQQLAKQSLEDTTLEVQQSAYWILHGENPYLTQAKTGVQNHPIVASDTISCIGISSQLNLIVGGSWQMLRFWDAQTGECLKQISAHSHWILSLAVSPDGKTVASASADKTLKVWNLETGELLKNFTPHSSWVTSVVFTSDGKHLISGSLDQKICVWDVQAGRLKKRFPRHSNAICSLILNSQGNLLFSGDASGKVTVWDVKNKNKTHEFQAHNYCVTSLAVNQNDNFLATTDLKNTKYWNILAVNSSKQTFLAKAFKALLPLAILWPNHFFDSFNVVSYKGLVLLIYWIYLKKYVFGLKDGAFNHGKIFESKEFVDTIGNNFLNFNSLKPQKGLIKHLIRYNVSSRNESGLIETIYGYHNNFVYAIAFVPHKDWLVTSSSNWIAIWDAKTGRLLHPLKGFSRSRLSRLEIHPKSVSLQRGETHSFQLQGYDQNGKSYQLNSVEWVCEGGTCNQNGTFKAGNIRGDYTITAVSEFVSVSAVIQITVPLYLASLEIQTPCSSLEFGQTCSLKIKGFDQYGDKFWLPTEQVQWSSSSGHIENGFFTAGYTEGKVKITAFYQRFYAELYLTVAEQPRLLYLDINPKEASVYPKSQIQFSLKGIAQLGKDYPLTQKIIWESPGNSIDQKGKFTASSNAKGEYSVIAFTENVTCRTSIHVLPVLKNIQFLGPDKISPNTEYQIEVKGFDQTGDEIELKDLSWSCTNGGCITPDGKISVEPQKENKIVVTVKSGTIKASHKIEILPVLSKLKLVCLEPDNQLEPGQEFQILLRGQDQYNNPYPIKLSSKDVLSHQKSIWKFDKHQISLKIKNRNLTFDEQYPWCFKVLERSEGKITISVTVENITATLDFDISSRRNRIESSLEDITNNLNDGIGFVDSSIEDISDDFDDAPEFMGFSTENDSDDLGYAVNSKALQKESSWKSSKTTNLSNSIHNQNNKICSNSLDALSIQERAEKLIKYDGNRYRVSLQVARLAATRRYEDYDINHCLKNPVVQAIIEMSDKLKPQELKDE